MEAEGRKAKLDARAERMREAGRCKSKTKDTAVLYIFKQTYNMLAFKILT